MQTMRKLKTMMDILYNSDFGWLVIVTLVIVALVITAFLVVRYIWIGNALAHQQQQAAVKPESTPSMPTADTQTMRPSSRSSTSVNNDSEDFSLSLATAAATNSTLLGFAVGGSITGAIIGDALVPDISSNNCTGITEAPLDGGSLSSCLSDSTTNVGSDW